ncbi:MAG TPA: hypothetical protein VIW73_09155 [Candidatus Cybelea sp.]
MSATLATGVGVKIEWDDGVMIVFSFQGASGKVYCGFPHVIPAWQSQTGTQTEVSTRVQSITQTAVQISGDPATWVETVKYGARDGKTIDVTYDDTINVNYTTSTATPYQLQLLYSING